MDNLIIRKATLDDAPQIADVHVATWRAAYKGLMPEDLLQRLDVVRRQRVWEDIINRAETSLIVAEVDDRIVGFSNSGGSRDPNALPVVGEIYAIYLLASYWGQGIGKAMMESSLRELEKRGFTSTTLWVLAANQRSIDFYTGMGFYPDGEQKDENWGEFVTSEIRMVRN